MIFTILKPAIVIDASRVVPWTATVIDVVNLTAHPVTVVLFARASFLFSFLSLGVAVVVVVIVLAFPPAEVVHEHVVRLAVDAYGWSGLGQVDNAVLNAVGGDAMDLVGLVAADDGAVAIHLLVVGELSHVTGLDELPVVVDESVLHWEINPHGPLVRVVEGLLELRPLRRVGLDVVVEIGQLLISHDNLLVPH
jgi:hypothetical protein